MLKTARRRATPAPPEKQFFAFFEFCPRRIFFGYGKELFFWMVRSPQATEERICYNQFMTDFIGVKIALINNDQLLMIQRDDKPGLRYAGLWDFPGGAREDGETPAECVIREVDEELGIKVNPKQIIYQRVHPAMHDPKLNAYFMVAEISDKDIENIVFGDEGQGWKMFSFDEFMNSNEVVKPLKGRIKIYFDAKVQG